MSEDYSKMVEDLCKPGEDIVYGMRAGDGHLVHMALGVAGEAGEVVDIIKKMVIYNKPQNITSIVEELGDLEFYLEGLRQGLGITRKEVLEANMTKLNKRYGDGRYTDEAAINRADKDV